MPGEWRERLPDEEPWRSRHIADFIAGMTDRYAVARYRERVGPIDCPKGSDRPRPGKDSARGQFDRGTA